VLDEFMFSDLAVVDNRVPRLEAQLKKTRNEKQERELALIKDCNARLGNNQPLREIELSADDEKLLRGYQFLTSKPLLVVVNISEGDIPRTAAIEEEFRKQFSGKMVECVALSAAIEMEISQLADEDAENFRKDLQITEPALNKMIRSAYSLLGLISFFTFGDKEVRSWTCRRGATASQAAGVIHSDFERGFIRAEVTFFEDLLRLKSLARCREQALLRLEGRDYPVKDGDVVEFRFNV
jgi:GTP-binding protein YchF